MSDETSQQPTNHAPTRAGGAARDISAPQSAADSTATRARSGKGFAAVSNLRFALAMAVAVLADTIGIPFGEIGVVVFDVAVGLILALCLRGFRPEIILACLIEAIPGFGLFPSWSLAVPAIWARMRLGASGAAATGPGRESSRPR
jgi:hypothetical protein